MLSGNVYSGAKEFHDKNSLFKMIDDGVTGTKLNWGPEKKPPKIKVDLPNNSPLLISDYHSIWGASGGRRTWEGKNVKHHGVDFYVKPGDPILAANSGKVILTINEKCAGPTVVIRHPGNKYAYYLHVGAFKVKKGDKVKAGDTLIIIEAMKMEHSLLAPRDGVVAEVLAQEGDQVEAGAALVRLAPVEEAAS